MNKKIIIGIMIIDIIVLIILVFMLYKLEEEPKTNLPADYTGPLSGQINENIERTTKEEDIKEGIIITNSNIKLDEYKENITINKGGKYILSGNLNSTLIINTKENVELVLNDVNITAQITAGIINKQENKLIINLPENTKNYITDNGNSVYASVIYSNGELLINGNGELNIKTKQQFSEGISTENKNITIENGIINIESSDDGINTGGEIGGTITINNGNLYIVAQADAIDSNKDLIINNGTIYASGGLTGSDGAIDTDKGFIINGGTLIALGYNHIEIPLDETTQNTLVLNIDEIDANNIVSLTNIYDSQLISFKTKNKINKITISHPYLSQEEYRLYKNNTHTGKIIQGIYMDGEVQLKDKIKDKIVIYSTITEIMEEK